MIMENQLVNQFLLLYKYTIYFNRDKLVTDILPQFKAKVKETEKTEYYIAKKRGKIERHLQKWEQYNRFMYM